MWRLAGRSCVVCCVIVGGLIPRVPIVAAATHLRLRRVHVVRGSVVVHEQRVAVDERVRPARVERHGRERNAVSAAREGRWVPRNSGRRGTRGSLARTAGPSAQPGPAEKETGLLVLVAESRHLMPTHPEHSRVAPSTQPLAHAPREHTPVAGATALQVRVEPHHERVCCFVVNNPRCEKGACVRVRVCKSLCGRGGKQQYRMSTHRKGGSASCRAPSRGTST